MALWKGWNSSVLLPYEIMKKACYIGPSLPKLPPTTKLVQSFIEPSELNPLWKKMSLVQLWRHHFDTLQFQSSLFAQQPALVSFAFAALLTISCSEEYQSGLKSAISHILIFQEKKGSFVSDDLLSSSLIPSYFFALQDILMHSVLALFSAPRERDSYFYCCLLYSFFSVLL